MNLTKFLTLSLNCEQVAVKLKNIGCYEISLGDTIGIGTPGIYVDDQLTLLSETVSNVFR